MAGVGQVDLGVGVGQTVGDQLQLQVFVVLTRFSTEVSLRPVISKSKRCLDTYLWAPSQRRLQHVAVLSHPDGEVTVTLIHRRHAAAKLSAVGVAFSQHALCQLDEQVNLFLCVLRGRETGKSCYQWLCTYQESMVTPQQDLEPSHEALEQTQGPLGPTKTPWNPSMP